MLRKAVLDGAPAPDDALRRYERIAQAAKEAGIDLPPDVSAATVLAAACQRAPYLANLLARDPRRLARVATDPYLTREKPPEVARAELARALKNIANDDGDLFNRALRHYRADEMVRLGTRELAIGAPDEVGRELSRLAEVSFDAAIGFHRNRLDNLVGPPLVVDDTGATTPARFVVIGMGKLGGQELNFVSDVDVIYAYDSDEGHAGKLTLHEYFSRLSRSISASLADVTDDDCVFRVDLRLRPEGSRGTIANSLPSLERYYESFGRPWERQAWLKARPCAGDLGLGEEVLDMLRPFIYPRATSAAVVDNVRELNHKIKSELDGGGIESGYDVKNGVGGIREIEFFVQALQLIHSGRMPAIRRRSTIGALDQLLFAGLVNDTERTNLVLAYRFLRHVEHVIQLDSGRQTQRLPSTDDEQSLLARRLGYADASAFLAVLRTHTAEVGKLFGTLGRDDSGPSTAVVALLGGELSRERECAMLAELGFADPEAARDSLERARKKPLSPLAGSATGAAARVAPVLLEEISNSPNPNLALRFVEDLIAKRGSWALIWRLMDQSPALIRVLVSLFGTSEFLSRTFVEHPELTDMLLSAGMTESIQSPEQLKTQLDARLREVPEDDIEGHWNTLAEFKNGHVLRIGLADIAGDLDAEEVCTELSSLAEVSLARAFAVVSQSFTERHGIAYAPDGTRSTMAILAMGKLGGRELGYASDLDVVFVYSADGESDGKRPLDAVTYMSRLAQRLMGALHAYHAGGRLYEVDTRLRPAGSQGLLVSSLTAWSLYHQRDAQLWEKQALTKLRFAAGDPVLGALAVRSARDCVYGGAPIELHSIAEAILTMRQRIETELSGQVKGYDIKTSRGGLVDIEFAAQFLQLAHGHQHPEMRTTKTTEALKQAIRLNLARPEDLGVMVEGYQFLRMLEHRMRIVHDRSVHRLPQEGEELEGLARRLGLTSGDALRETFSRWTGAIRAAYNGVLGVR